MLTSCDETLTSSTRPDAVLSTSGMLRYARSETAEEFVIGTEVGLLHRLSRENPGKRFFPLSANMICRTMKLTSLADVADALEGLRHAVEVPEPVRVRAHRAVDTMLRLI